MKKPSLILALAAGLLCLTALVACTQDDLNNANGPSADAGEGSTEAETESESVSGDESTTESGSESGSDSQTETTTAETVTAAPRYDYIAAEVAPDVELDASVYTDMKLTIPADLQVTDEDVDEYIDTLRFQYRTATNGTTQVKDQAMKRGDVAYIYYKGVTDGKEFEGGSNWEETSPYALSLGSGAFIPGFEEGLMGVIPADTSKDKPVEVHVTFPENYTEDLAGKDAIFYVCVEYAVQYTIPDYTVEFIETTLQYEWQKEFYASPAARLTEFEDYVRTYLEDEAAATVESAKIDALWTYLTENIVCKNHPQLELDFYFNSYMADLDEYYDYYSSTGGETFLKEYPDKGAFAVALFGLEEGVEWETGLRDMARRIVSRDMIMHAIAEREGIETVTDKEYEDAIAELVDYYQGYMTREDIIATMGETALRETAFATKMQEWLLTRATFTYEETAE